MNDLNKEKVKKLEIELEQILSMHDSVLEAIANIDFTTISPEKIYNIKNSIEQVSSHYEKMEEELKDCLHQAWQTKNENFIEKAGHIKEKMHAYCFRKIPAKGNYKVSLSNYFEEYLNEKLQNSD